MFCVKYHYYKLDRDPVECANTLRAGGCERAASHGRSDSEQLPGLESHGLSASVSGEAGRPLVRLLDVGAGNMM